MNKTYKLNLEIITPCHVGSGISLNTKEYLYDYNHQIVYFLNHLAWHKFIYTHNLFAKYENYLLKTPKSKNLYDWLISCNYSIEDLKQANAISSSTLAPNNILVNKQKRTLHDINCHIKQIDGSIYVPGSSIKGVIRNALMYHFITTQLNSSEYRKHITNSINDILYAQNNDRYKLKQAQNRISSDLEKAFNNKLRKSDETKLTGISCSDTLNKGIISTAILPKKDIVINNFGQIKEAKLPLPIYRECILPQNNFEFMLTIDEAILAKLNIYSLKDLLAVIQKYFAFINNLFSNAFDKDVKCANLLAQTQKANIYLGGNTGFLTKTLIAALAKNNAEATKVIAKILANQFKKAAHHKDRYIAPRTLKTTVYKDKSYLMGLAKVSLK